MRVTTTIDGRRVRLRPATLADRRMIHDWSYASDVAPLLHLSDPPTRPLEDWCDDWEERYFTDAEPDRGRMFVVLDGDTPVGAIAYNDIDVRRRVELDVWRAHDPQGGARPMTPSRWVDVGAGVGSG